MSEKWCHPGCMDGESATQIQQHLASCSIEELQDGLSDLVLGDDDSDETIALIDAYLAELDARSPCTINISAEESLRDFHEKYDYLFETEPTEVEDPRPVKRRLIRRYVLLAATIALVVCLLAVQVVGVNWVEVLVRWTSETFGLVFEEVPSEIPQEKTNAFDDLRIVLRDHNITEIKVPSLLPSEYELCELKTTEDGSLIRIGYEHGDSFICLQIRKIAGELGTVLEKNPQDPKVYVSDGIKYYVAENLGEYSAVWEVGEYECILYGIPSENLLYEMLDSMK